MRRESTVTFTDANGDEWEASYTPGYPAITGGPPDRWDPGEAPEVYRIRSVADGSPVFASSDRWSELEAKALEVIEADLERAYTRER